MGHDAYIDKTTSEMVDVLRQLESWGSRVGIPQPLLGCNPCQLHRPRVTCSGIRFLRQQPREDAWHGMLAWVTMVWFV